MQQGKRNLDVTEKPRKFKKRKVKPMVVGSADDVLLAEVESFLRKIPAAADQDDLRQGDERSLSLSRFDEVEVDIVEITSSGSQSSDFR